MVRQAPQSQASSNHRCLPVNLLTGHAAPRLGEPGIRHAECAQVSAVALDRVIVSSASLVNMFGRLRLQGYMIDLIAVMQ